MRKVLYVSLSSEMRSAFHFVHSSCQIPHSGSVEAISRFIFWWVYRCFRSILRHALTRLIVLSIIQEKVNNPSPDDPFEPDIAAVCFFT